MTNQLTYLIIYEDLSPSVVNNLDDTDYNAAWNNDITIVDITDPQCVELLVFDDSLNNYHWEIVNGFN